MLEHVLKYDFRSLSDDPRCTGLELLPLQRERCTSSTLQVDVRVDGLACEVDWSSSRDCSRSLMGG